MHLSTRPTDEQDIAYWPLATVAQLCRQESLHYLQRTTHDPRFCFELFRRAILQRNEHAWATLFIQYTQETPLAPHWVEHHPLFLASGEDTDYFVNRAFEKMWAALRPEKFDRFPDLASLLRYLKLCVNSVITDHMRRIEHEAIPWEDLERPIDDHVMTDSLPRQEFWRMIDSRLRDTQERTAIFCRFDAGMKPAEIQTQYPDLFADVKDVYRVLQNVLNRLRHDPSLRAYLEMGD
jgi:hypothetical protein